MRGRSMTHPKRCQWYGQAWVSLNSAKTPPRGPCHPAVFYERKTTTRKSVRYDTVKSPGETWRSQGKPSEQALCGVPGLTPLERMEILEHGEHCGAVSLFLLQVVD